jgi:hypothetical protein
MCKLLLLAIATSVRVIGHEGEPLAPHDVWWAWSFDPLIVIGLLLSVIGLLLSGWL